MSILLPLYVYPHAGAWSPLYSAAKAHPDVDFTVVVNPCSGPCMNGSLPDKVYLDEIPKLKTFENIRTLGYVATHYGAKELNSVLAEIDTYANWPKVTNNTKLRVDGIFFDETPSGYSVVKYDYLKAASQAVRNKTRFRDHFVVHNPGLVAPALLNSPTVLQNSFLNLSDITVVFEETFAKWLDKATFDPLRTHNIRRSKLAVILHSLPNLSKTVLDFVVQQVEETADWLFLTDVGVKDEYYHGFSAIFEDVVRSVDGGAEEWEQ
ncbi:Spherulation-specific family 4 [Massariosphaeria phaeospora]|uniref:Spherulation-specific family 4 n=1 Tax=Massariosphaeria phaeospora TaxID=100035 RepID=A0A7C8IK08_9PLEO|nr:Spherulation-specific family 4 [Massariosphaeria phaeospora]